MDANLSFMDNLILENHLKTYTKVLGISDLNQSKDINRINRLKEKIIAKADQKLTGLRLVNLKRSVEYAAYHLIHMANNTYSRYDTTNLEQTMMLESIPIIREMMCSKEDTTIMSPTSPIEDTTIISPTSPIELNLQDEPAILCSEPTPIEDEAQVQDLQDDNDINMTLLATSHTEEAMQATITQTQVTAQQTISTPPVTPLATPEPEKEATEPKDSSNTSDPSNSRTVQYIVSHRYKTDAKKNIFKRLEFTVKYSDLPFAKTQLKKDMIEHKDALIAYFNDDTPIRHPKSGKKPRRDALNTICERERDLAALIKGLE